MGLFGGKKKTDVPIDEVQKMTAQGMSDKDIIKKLKGQGYSYDAIEKAMMQAVKEGAGDESAAGNTMQDVPSFPESMGAPQPQGGGEALFPEFEPQEVPEVESVNPEVVIEELIEGVIEDKWNRFSKDMDGIRSELNIMRAEIKQAPRGGPAGNTKELEAKLADLSEQLEELDARVGGLEKAFKQFLPSLTRNIEALSKMIHEMKEKHGAPQEESLLS